MNQEQNNLNQNSFNTQNNNVVSNAQNINNTYIQTQQVNQNIYQQPVQNNNINQSGKKNNKTKSIIIIVLIAIIIGVITFIAIKSLNNKNNNTQINSETSVVDSIWKDYNNGTITIDEYVKYMLYADYDSDLLNSKYKLLKGVDLIEIDDFIEKHYNELSNETLKYYAEKINLKGITFELDKENETINNKVALSNLLIEDVYAEEQKTTNLNKAILSRNGNFVVWYTTTGDSATDYNTAKKVADGLENTVEQYTKLFGRNYYYKSTMFSKGSRYKEQLKILENSNIDTKYLESAMQVYLVNYVDSSLGKYVGNAGTLLNLLNGLSGGDDYGTIANPYILIKPSAFDDYERLEQIYNHELFHHYQHEVLCGHSECEVGKDPYILEASANWASALVTKKTTNYGYLNENASVAIAFAHNLLSEEIINKYGYDVAYALYVYLYNYSNIVKDGNNIIINSIYSDDALGYLIDHAKKEDLSNIQESIALYNLSQDYENKNLNQDLNRNYKINIRANISRSDSKYKSNNTYYNYSMSPISQNYYLIDDDSSYAYQIHLERDNSSSSEFISATIIKLENGIFSVVDSSKNSKESYTFDTNNYGNYDKLYIVISNTYINRKNSHILNVREIKKETVKSSEKKGYISLIDCDGYFDEDKEKMIDTYYFDKDENVYKYVVTVYWKNEESAEINYKNNLSNSNYTNVRKNGKVVSFEYTEDSLNKFPSMTKSSVIGTHTLMCSSSNIEVDYNPNY